MEKCPKPFGLSLFCKFGQRTEFQLPRMPRSMKKRWAAGGLRRLCGGLRRLCGGRVAQAMWWFHAHNNATWWLHLASWDLPDSQLS